MWFFLPDEGMTPEELLSDEEAMEFLFCITGNSGLPLFVGIVNDPVLK